MTSALQSQSITPNIGLSDKTRYEVCTILHVIGADLFLLHANAMFNVHNVVGPRAQALKFLFKGIAEAYLCGYHTIAEHVRHLGYRIPTVGETIKLIRLPLLPDGKWPDSHDMLKRALSDCENFLQTLETDREKVGSMDAVVIEDTLLLLIRKIRGIAVELRIHLESDTVSPVANVAVPSKSGGSVGHHFLGNIF